MMKSLLLKLVIPLTIISFFSVTQAWYAVVDGPNTILSGFPFPFVCSAWYTSMALQFFALEFLADLMIYFLFWLFITKAINRFLWKITVHKFVTLFLWIIASFFLVVAGMILSLPEHLYLLKRDFEMDVVKTEISFFWETSDYSVFEELDEPE